MKKKEIIVYHDFYKDSAEELAKYVGSDVELYEYNEKNFFDNAFDELKKYDTIYFLSGDSSFSKFFSNPEVKELTGKIVPIILNDCSRYKNILGYEDDFDARFKKIDNLESIKIKPVEVNGLPFWNDFIISRIVSSMPDSFMAREYYAPSVLLSGLLPELFQLTSPKNVYVYINGQKIKLPYSEIIVSPFGERNILNNKVNLFVNTSNRYIGSYHNLASIQKGKIPRNVEYFRADEIVLNFKPCDLTLDNMVDGEKVMLNCVTYNFSMGDEITLNVPKVRKR